MVFRSLLKFAGCCKYGPGQLRVPQCSDDAEQFYEQLQVSALFGENIKG